MHRKKVISILFVLPPPAFQSLGTVETQQGSKTVRGLSTVTQLEEAASAMERRAQYSRAAVLMYDALLARSELSTEVKHARELALRVLLVLHSWVVRFIREGASDQAFSVLKTLSNLTSPKSPVLFKGKRAWRSRVMVLYAWYYSRVTKFHAAMDYIATSRQTLKTDLTKLDIVITALMEGFILSNLGSHRDAIEAYSSAYQSLSAPRSSDLEDRVFYPCLAVTLFNLAADHLNLFQQQQAGDFIQFAFRVATSHLPVGSFARDKIRALYEQLLGVDSLERQLTAPDERVTETQLEPPSLRTSGTGKSHRSSALAVKVPALRTPHRYPSSRRQHSEEKRQSSRATSVVIAQNLPLNEKVIRPYRRRKFLREKSMEEYGEAERLLRVHEESARRCTTPDGVRLPEQPLRPAEGRTASVGKGRNVRLVTRYFALDLSRAFQTAAARWRIRKTYRAAQLLYELTAVRVRRQVEIALRCLELNNRTCAAIVIQRTWRGLQSRRSTERRLGACGGLRALAQRTLLRLCFSSLSTGVKSLRLAAARWRRFALSLAARHNHSLAAVAAQEMKALSRAGSTSASRASVAQCAAGLLSEEWLCSAAHAAEAWSGRRAAFAEWKRKLQVCREAAVKLQCFARSILQRRRYLSLLRVVRLLQTHLRAWRRRRRAAAALTVQRFYRGFRSRTRLKRSQSAAVCIQRRFRGALARRSQKQRAVAAGVIQCAVQRRL